MYNLIVSGNNETWKTNKYSLEFNRCVREHTRREIIERYGELSDTTLEELKRYPCVFAYENYWQLPPRFGWFKNLTRRAGEIVMECEFQEITPWMDEQAFRAIQSRLDITGFEMNRTHWAVKEIDLAEELATIGITIPAGPMAAHPVVNPEFHEFEVAFSFPGEARPFVNKVLAALEKHTKPNDIFYDNHYMAFLARPNLNYLLTKIYRENSKLIVVFLSGDYERKPWCGLEFRAVQEILFYKGDQKVMYIRMDQAPVTGVSVQDGFIDASKQTPFQIAAMIHQRIADNAVIRNTGRQAR